MRADRLISLVLLLRSKGRLTAVDLARQLEVSERTIYRDLDALSTAGIPVYTQSGANGGIFLDEHYRLALTALSLAEVRSLFISSDAGPLKDLGLGRAMEDTRVKLFSELPSAHRSEVERLRQRFYIDPAGWFQRVEPAVFLPLLQQAVWEDWRIRAVYKPVDGDERERLIEAYALVAKANVWYLVGKNAEGAMHYYRLSRFKRVALAETHFERDPQFDLAEYWKVSCRNFEADMAKTFPPYRVLLRVHPDTYWYFPAHLSDRFEQVGEPEQDGWVKLCAIFESFAEARSRVLGLQNHVVVLEPDELRNSVIESARAILAFYGE